MGALDAYDPFQINGSATFSSRAAGEDPFVSASLSFAFDPHLREGQQVRLTPRTNPLQPSITLFDPLLQSIDQSGHLAMTNGTMRLYAHDGFPYVGISSLADLPLGARIASPVKLPLADESAAPQIADLATPDPPTPASLRSNLSVGLVRDQTILFYAPGGTHYPQFDIKDLNLATGADPTTFTFKGLDGEVIQSFYTFDDGNLKKDGKASTRSVFVPFTVAEPQWVFVELRNTTSDVRFQDIVLPGPSYFSRAINLGGPQSETKGRFPLELTVLTHGADLTATAQSTFGGQDITITDMDGESRTLNVPASKVKALTRLEAGTYRLRLTNGSVLLGLTEGYFSFLPPPLSWPVSDFVQEDAANETLRITTALRGNHVFWTRISDGRLDLSLAKQDMNTNVNDDNLTLSITGLNGALVHQEVVPDDGNLTNRSLAGPQQRIEIHVRDLPTGTYRIEMKGSGDYRLRELTIHPNRLVAQKLLPLGFNSCCFKTVTSDSPLDLYYASPRGGQVTFNTSHTQGEQDVRFTPVGPNSTARAITASVGEVKKAVAVNVPANEPYRLRLPNQDVTLTGTGFFSFTPASFFYPYRYEVVPWKNNITYVEERADYVFVDFGNFQPLTVLDGEGHYRIQKSWQASELDLKDGKFQFTLQVTNFQKPGYENRTAYFHDLRVELQYKPFWKGNGFLEWIHKTFA